MEHTLPALPYAIDALAPAYSNLFFGSGRIITQKNWVELS